MGITGCILAKNEEGSIGSCIKQMAKFVDEIQDDGSIGKIQSGREMP